MNLDADIDVPLKDPWSTPPEKPSPRPRHAAADPAEAVASWPVVKRAEEAQATIGDPGRAHAEVRPRLRSDPAQPPDTVVDHGTAVALEVRAASVRGLSHRESGTPRQDAYGFALTAGEEYLIVVVADGVSAGVLSHEAASFVGRRGPREVARHLDAGTRADELPWPEIFTALAATILAEGARSLRRTDPARYADDPPAETEVAAAMATTATFLVCPTTPARGGARDVHLAWMGDSPAWAVDPDGSWHNLSEVKGAGAEVASSRVEALPRIPRDPAGLPRASHRVPDDWTLLVMTDGTGDPLGPAQGEVAERLAAWWRRPPLPLTFADQVGFGRRSYDDDRTVVAIWPVAGREPG